MASSYICFVVSGEALSFRIERTSWSATPEGVDLQALRSMSLGNGLVAE